MTVFPLLSEGPVIGGPSLPGRRPEQLGLFFLSLLLPLFSGLGLGGPRLPFLSG
jgi:hypothetical protein